MRVTIYDNGIAKVHERELPERVHVEGPDEVFVDHWLHVEYLGGNVYMLIIGHGDGPSLHVEVTTDEEGRAVRIQHIEEEGVSR